jgi:hypothetical protein
LTTLWGGPCDGIELDFAGDSAVIIPFLKPGMGGAEYHATDSEFSDFVNRVMDDVHDEIGQALYMPDENGKYTFRAELP